MNNKQVHVILLLIVLGGLFYWFQYRPSVARKDCYNYARYDSSLSNPQDNFDSLQIQQFEKLRFDQCLHHYGL